eukprot:SAG22_NODE_662_length_8055_cov_5.450980_6_plen_149_part_00
MASPGRMDLTKLRSVATSIAADDAMLALGRYSTSQREPPAPPTPPAGRRILVIEASFVPTATSDSSTRPGTGPSSSAKTSTREPSDGGRISSVNRCALRLPLPRASAQRISTVLPATSKVLAVMVATDANSRRSASISGRSASSASAL